MTTIIVCAHCGLLKREHCKAARGNIWYCWQGSTMFKAIVKEETK